MFHLYPFLSFIFVTAYTPGPNNLLSMSYAGRLGFRKSFRFNLGILCGFVSVMVLCAVFSAALYALIPKIKPVMVVVGSAYMLLLAWKVWKSSADAETKAESGCTFLTGCLLQFVNPKIFIYGITAISAYILPVYQSPVILLAFVLLLSAVGFSASMCWALFGTAFSKLFKEHSKPVNAVMVILLIYCAVSLLLPQ